MKKCIHNVLISLVISFMLFIFAPLEMLFSNMDEVFYDASLLLKPMSLVFVAFFVLLSLVLCLAQKTKMYEALYCLVFVIFLSTYIQGTYFAGWLPKLDGTSIIWSDYSKYRIICIFTWIIVSLLIVILYKHVKRQNLIKAITGVSVALGLIMLANIVTMGISCNGFASKEIYADTSTTKNMFAYSENKNFLILVLDKTDATVMNEFLEDHTEYLDIFNDFTFYTNMESMYPYTHHSVPLMLTGVPYEKQCDYSHYLNEVYENSRLFAELEKRDYSIGIYETLFKMKNSNNRFDNLVKCEHDVSSWVTFTRWQIMLVGYKYAPFDLKRFCFLVTNAFNNLKVIPGETVFSDYNEDFWVELQERPTNRIETNNFRFIHVYGAHNPWISTEDMKPVENGTYEDGIKVSLSITQKYLQKYKEAGCYDNSVIIIMADHGYSTGFQENPIFFVKGIDEHHQMQKNDAPVSFADLMDAYIRLLDGNSSNDIFDWKEGDKRERKFLFQDDDDNPEEIMEEYVQKGRAGQEDTFVKIREF